MSPAGYRLCLHFVRDAFAARLFAVQTGEVAALRRELAQTQRDLRELRWRVNMLEQSLRRAAPHVLPPGEDLYL